MTRNAVAVVSAVLFVVLAALLAVLPVPYVTSAPGAVFNALGSADGQPVVRVEGIQTYPTTGQVLATTVLRSRADAQVSLPEALFADWSTGSEVLPRDWVYQPGRTTEQLQAAPLDQLQTSQHLAAVAALRASGNPVEEFPMVASVNVGGPSFNVLQVGDFITKVNTEAVTSERQVREQIERGVVGDPVLIEVVRNTQVLTVQIVTVSSNQDRRIPTIGIGYSLGYRFGPSITYGPDNPSIGASAGLAFALGIYDQVTSEDLIGDQIVGVAGTIDARGAVGRTTAIRQRLHAALRANATVFLVPAANCEDVADVNVGIKVVKVTTLQDAIVSLRLLAENGPNAEVPHC